MTGYHIGDHEEFRFEPSADLPIADELATRVAESHRIDLIESLGPIRIESELNMEKLGIEGQTSTLLAWPDRFRMDTTAGSNFERVAYDGERVQTASTAKPAAVLEGRPAELLILDSPLARFGDWHGSYTSLQTIQRLERGGKTVILVRAGDTSAPAPTFYIDSETGLVLREESLAHIETMGRIGQRITFGDYRDVSGMQLPHRTEVEYANPLIGTIVLTVTETELGVELPDGTFNLIE